MMQPEKHKMTKKFESDLV